MADQIVCRSVHQQILSRDADYQSRIEGIEIDWQRAGVQGCKRTSVLLVYTYQTCFDVLVSDDGKISESLAIYYYTKPRPILSPSRIVVSTKYYFDELPLGMRLKTVDYQGNTTNLLR